MDYEGEEKNGRTEVGVEEETARGENQEKKAEEEGEEEEEEEEVVGVGYSVLRVILVLLFPVVAAFSVSLVIGLVAVFAADFSISSPVPVPSQCRIVSSSVDIRSAKVCELGLLNYKAKNVLYPFERKRFRCRYDYYWASVFQVEYKDHALGQTRQASAEAPSEALPLDCRPNFGVAWLTKDIFKVNETYDCWYKAGVSKVSLYRDSFFGCQSKDPSAVEMFRRYVILCMETLRSLFVRKKGNAHYWRWETLAGVVTGFSTSIISISFIRVLQLMKPHLQKTYPAKVVARIIKSLLVRRACFFLVYVSIIGWLTIQCGKRLGFHQILRSF